MSGPLGLRDDNDRIIALLESIATSVGGPEPGRDEGGLDDSLDEDRTPDYFTTGPDPLKITADDGFVKLDFDLVARTVNIRTTDAIVISFTKPDGGDQDLIGIRDYESPFTMGGANGIDAPRMWVKKDTDEASTDPAIQIIAYR